MNKLKNVLLLSMAIIVLSCGEDPAPKSILIRSVTISDLPLAKPDGSPWDPINRPDIVVSIGTFITPEFTEYDISNPLQLTVNKEFTYNSTLVFTVTDIDFDNNDVMIQGSTILDWPLDRSQINLTIDGTSILIDDYDIVY